MPDDAEIESRALQLRLFPAPKPLVDRLGVEFFRRVPTSPGVYLMTGEQERLLYVGKAANLRARLNSYRHIQPERASRKVVRLIHAVRTVVWEICDSPESALLRENELLRLHKPKFNVMNARPEHYLFIGVRTDGTTLHLRLTKQPERLPGETLHGAFKSLGRVRRGFVALLRLLWQDDHRPQSIHEYPSALVGERCPDQFSMTRTGGSAEELAMLLREMLEGGNAGLIQQIENHAPASDAGALCEQRLREADLEALKQFCEFGPARNRRLREHSHYTDEVIAQNDLDDLLVLTPTHKSPAPSSDQNSPPLCLRGLV